MNLDRWKSFPKREQLLMIGSEIMRAKIWCLEDKEKFILALERALELVDLSLADRQWDGQFFMLLWLRQEIAKFYQGIAKYDIEILYKGL